jgi:hypothetical protein
LIGAMIGIGVSLLLNAAYSATSAGADLSVPPWQSALERIAGSALTFGSADDVYQWYGRVLVLVLAALMVGLYGLYSNQGAVSNGKPRRSVVLGYRLAMIGLALALVGNFGDYWLRLGTILAHVFFVVGTVLGLLLVAIGLILFGVGGLRGGTLARPVAWALIMWFPLAIVLALLGMENLPSLLLLPLSVAWAITGIAMVQPGWSEAQSFGEAGVLEKA